MENKKLENTSELNLDEITKAEQKDPRKSNKKKIIVAVSVCAVAVACAIGLVACNNKAKEPMPIDSSETKTDSKDDKTAPVIKLKTKSVTVEKGSKWSATDNIESVKDDDKDLLQVKQESKGSAYYLIDDSKVDLNKVGDYTVTVHASDKADNVSEASFKVSVVDSTAAKKDEKKADSKSDSSKNDSSKQDSKKNAEKKNDSTKKSEPKKSAPAVKKEPAKPAPAPAQPAQPQQHVHNWVHHDATGHYETKTVTDKTAWTETVVDQAAWDETVVTGYQCVTCKQVFNTLDEIDTHLDISEDCGSNYKLLTTSVHHDAVTHDVNHPAETHQENVWIQDTAAYDVCSGCGQRK